MLALVQVPQMALLVLIQYLEALPPLAAVAVVEITRLALTEVLEVAVEALIQRRRAVLVFLVKETLVGQITLLLHILLAVAVALALLVLLDFLAEMGALELSLLYLVLQLFTLLAAEVVDIPL